MSDIEIIVTVRGMDVEVKDSKDDATMSGKLNLDKLREDTIAIFQSWVTKSQISRRIELEVFGRHLFDALFNGDVRSFFEEKLRGALNRQYQLRVQLSFKDKDAAKLGSWPWEYLYYAPESGEGVFLSTKVDLVLSRYMPLGIGRSDNLIGDKEPLKLLVAVSQPSDKDLGPVLADPVIEAIQQLAAEHPIQIQIERLNKPTVDNLLKELEKFQPHVLHFIGHGRFNKSEKQGEIALLNVDETSVMWVPDKVFAEYFGSMQSVPRLVFLHLCQGATVELEANFAGLAPQLMLTGVQAVVAMQHPITNLAAISFSKTFYREVAQGKTVDYAVQRGRYRITTDIEGAYSNRVFGTPVLYLRCRNAQLVKSGETQTEQSRQPGLGGPGLTSSTPSIIKSDLGGISVALHVSPHIITSLKKAARKEAHDQGLDSSKVTDIMKRLNWQTNMAALRKELCECIADASDDGLEAVYRAMCDALDKLSQPGGQLP